MKANNSQIGQEEKEHKDLSRNPSGKYHEEIHYTKV